MVLCRGLRNGHRRYAVHGFGATAHPAGLPFAPLRSGGATGMYTHETSLRVRYGETDRMGFVYYGDYAEYFEVGRVEALRHLGFPYRALEERGIMLPVLDLHVRYLRAARYDDLVTVRTTITAMPAARIHFRYEVLAEDGTTLTEATTSLVFVDAGTMRPRRAPDDLLAALAPYFPVASR